MEHLTYEILDDGSLLIQGELTISFNGEQIETFELRISNADYVKNTFLGRSGEMFKNGDTILVTNGTLSKNEDGSILIAGSDVSRVSIARKSGKGTPDTGLLVEFQGDVVLSEAIQGVSSDDDSETTAPVEAPVFTEMPVPVETLAPTEPPVYTETPVSADTTVPVENTTSAENPAPPEATTSTETTAPTEAPVPEETTEPKATATNIVQENDSIYIKGKVNFHAVDTRTGWHPEEQTDALQIQNYELDPALEGINISGDSVLQIQGGICTKTEDGGILITADPNDPDGRIYLSQGASPEHAQHEGFCVAYEGIIEPPVETKEVFSPWLFGGSVLMAAILGAAVSWFFTRRAKKKRKLESAEKVQLAATVTESLPAQTPTSVSVGQCQNIGKRPSQQDSKGLFRVNGGVFAVVADGMGGLKDGDKVSQKIVKTIGEDCKAFSAEQIRGNLMALVTHANDEVNRMLGPNDLYKSGSTTVAVLAEQQQFQWVSVGDSRVYLYRGGRLLQLNREHDFEADLMLRAVNHQISFQDAMNNPKRKSVSSFIGMGALKYVDEMRRPIRTVKGDRIMLCSDGVFNTLTEPKIESILGGNPDPNAAAAALEAAVLQANNPHQDNFTAIIIAYD